VPVAHIHEVDKNAIVKLLGACKNIDLHHISSVHNQGAVVELVFLYQNDREESQTGTMRPIGPTDVLDADCSIYNCVPTTDYEVPLETLLSIQQDSDVLEPRF